MHWTGLNIAWTLIALVGFLASLRVLSECLQDYMYVKRDSPHAVRKAVSEMAVLGELSRFVTLTFFLALGILSIVAPQRFLDARGIEILQHVIEGVFIAIALILTFTSVLQNVLRHVAIQKIDREEGDRLDLVDTAKDLADIAAKGESNA